jgi:hypothetical protein
LRSRKEEQDFDLMDFEMKDIDLRDFDFVEFGIGSLLDAFFLRVFWATEHIMWAIDLEV